MKKFTFIVGIALALSLLAACAMPAPMRNAPAATEYAAAPAENYVDGAMPLEPDTEWNTEEYSAEEENRFKSTTASPLSTFAADVDTASYANIRRKILAGEVPEPDSVRIEEMLNYFSYDYPAPAVGEPFSVTTEMTDCPWNSANKLLLIGLQADDIDAQALPASNLVFLLDVSGSMDDANKLPLMKRAFLLLAAQLRPEDRVSIVTYASDDRVVLEGVDGTRRTKVMSAIENLTAGGSTAGSKGIETAYELAERYFISGGNNRVILGTDGDLNIGVTSEGDLKRLIENKRDSGISLSVMGFGDGNLKDNKLETLADNGNGNYSYIDDVSEA
ncbi:MAG: von Willebrand factor type A domain-containing protein, partial [Christensenella sp.]|uniref:vWA domain-containing protein n=1 Tax=Christensenella sp. TaxID=1935934 RepID=UPI002B1FAB0D